MYAYVYPVSRLEAESYLDLVASPGTIDVGTPAASRRLRWWAPPYGSGVIPAESLRPSASDGSAPSLASTPRPTFVDAARAPTFSEFEKSRRADFERIDDRAIPVVVVVVVVMGTAVNGCKSGPWPGIGSAR